MIFINAVINKPNDLDYRIHLRNEFYASGFGNILEVFFFFFFFFYFFFFFFFLKYNIQPFLSLFFFQKKAS